MNVLDRYKGFLLLRAQHVVRLRTSTPPVFAELVQTNKELGAERGPHLIEDTTQCEPDTIWSLPEGTERKIRWSGKAM